uniref:Uncharacterized protein n=1 Tax=Lepeophtheirus salmonis TaxID=72036 RepID=A0A0K2VBT6_LEPSM
MTPILSYRLQYSRQLRRFGFFKRLVYSLVFFVKTSRRH